MQQLETSQTNSPQFWVWVASQVKSGARGFLSRDIEVRELVMRLGDIHHIFPKDLLKKAGAARTRYNQIANYVMMQSEINIAIGNKSPKDYFTQLGLQCADGKLKYGAICDPDELKENLKMHCIPDGMEMREVEHYNEFLEERRKLMATRIRDYYRAL